MFFLTHLVKAAYLLGLSLAVSLLLSAKPSQAQSHVTTGFRGAPGLPTIAFPILTSSSGFGGSFGGGFGGFGGGFGGFHFNQQVTYFNLGSLFPNGGRVFGMPPPPLQLPLSNFPFGFPGLPPFLGFPSLSDSTGAPWALPLSLGLFNGGAMGFGGGLGGFGGVGGFGGGVGGFGGGVGGVGGFGGFAGKGFGGFNGCKGL